MIISTFTVMIYVSLLFFTAKLSPNCNLTEEKIPLHTYLLWHSKQPSCYHSFNTKIGFKNKPLWDEVFEKKHSWFVVPCSIFCADILAQGGSFFKLIFVLKSCDQDGCVGQSGCSFKYL